MTGHATEYKCTLKLFEFTVTAFALVALLTAQWILSAVIHGANYPTLDGKMAQTTVLAALRFGGWFGVTNISPIEGIGSQLLPMNAWTNPAYWPFAFFDKELATDVSALVALAVFVMACYIMGRCFNVPILPSAITAQSCIVLFAPAVLILRLTTVFCLTPGNAVVYAPYMIMLGLLGRLEPGSWRRFGVTTAGILVLLFYSIYCDPLWTMVCGLSWAIPFVVVICGGLRLKMVLLRCAALASCFSFLLLSGAAGYLYTLSQFTARVQFPEVVDRPRGPDMTASALFYSPYMKYYCLAWALGWVLGLLTLRGRSRLFVLAGALTGTFLMGYSVVYLLLLNGTWALPLPFYVEHSLFPLFVTTAAAGAWSALRAAALLGQRLAAKVRQRVCALSRIPRLDWESSRLSSLIGASRAYKRWQVRFAAIMMGCIIVGIIPIVVVNYAANDAAQYAEYFHDRWPNEPELSFFADNVGQTVGQPLFGSLHFWTFSEQTGYTIVSAWAQGIHTIDEYSQLVTPQAFYILYALLQNNVTRALNGFVPFPGPSWANFWKAIQLWGARYYVADGEHSLSANKAGYPVVVLPQRRPGAAPGLWYVFELPRPNVGNYSPTEVVTAQSATQITALMRAQDFDFTRHVVLSTAIGEPLVPAHDMRLSRIRGGLHVSGKSDGLSLVVLPQQFSHCLRARDGRARFVRANLMMAGMIFSGAIDTDILFDYGVFSPGCRWADLADMKRLELKIDLRMPHLTGDRLFPDWNGVMARLRIAANAIR